MRSAVAISLQSWPPRLGSRRVPVKSADVTIFDKNQSKVYQEKTDELGSLKFELLEYAAKGKQKTYASPYTLVVGDVKKEVLLNKNNNITLILK